MSFYILAACFCIHVYIDSAIQCTTLILQVETLQYCDLQYHFSDSTCRTQKFLQCVQSSDIVLLENIFRIQLQDGYRKWHHSGVDWSARTWMGHKNITLRMNVLQLSELRHSRDLLVIILRLDIRAYCFNSS